MTPLSCPTKEQRWVDREGATDCDTATRIMSGTTRWLWIPVAGRPMESEESTTLEGRVREIYHEPFCEIIEEHGDEIAGQGLQESPV